MDLKYSPVFRNVRKDFSAISNDINEETIAKLRDFYLLLGCLAKASGANDVYKHIDRETRITILNKWGSFPPALVVHCLVGLIKDDILENHSIHCVLSADNITCSVQNFQHMTLVFLKRLGVSNLNGSEVLIEAAICKILENQEKIECFMGPCQQSPPNPRSLLKRHRWL